MGWRVVVATVAMLVLGCTGTGTQGSADLSGDSTPVADLSTHAETTLPADTTHSAETVPSGADSQVGDAMASNDITVADLSGTPSDVVVPNSCGNHSCDPGENCVNCPGDCGVATQADFGPDRCASFSFSSTCSMADVGRGPVPVSGATESFFGYFRFDARSPMTFSGLEYRVYLPNQTWIEHGGEPCQIVWNISGTQGPAQGCVSCDYSLSLSAVLNPTLTSCNEALVKTMDQTFKTTYNVKVTQGEAEFTFESGKLLGKGTGGGSLLTYQSAPRCAWF